MKSLNTLSLSKYLGVTKRTVQRRAIKEKWLYEQRIGLGGTTRFYAFTHLPKAIQQKITVSIIIEHQKALSCGDIDFAMPQRGDPYLCQEITTKSWIDSHIFSENLQDNQLNKTFIQWGLLSLAYVFSKHFGLGKVKGFDKFCQLYTNRSLVIDSNIYNIVKKISRVTLLRWERKSLQDKNGNRAAINKRDLKRIAEEVLMVSPDTTAKNLRRHFMTFFTGQKLPNINTIEHWIIEIKEDGI